MTKYPLCADAIVRRLEADHAAAGGGDAHAAAAVGACGDEGRAVDTPQLGVKCRWEGRQQARCMGHERATKCTPCAGTQGGCVPPIALPT